MIDDDFQLPVLVAKYINRGNVDDKRKKNFLMRINKIGRSNLELILIKYAQRGKTTDFIKFPVQYVYPQAGGTAKMDMAVDATQWI
jgi:hypothetical protein